MKKFLALMLILCLCCLLVPCAAVSAAAPDEQALADLTEAIFEANTLDSVFSRHESVDYSFRFLEGYGNDVTVWETADTAFYDWGYFSRLYDGGDLFYQSTMTETGEPELVCGPYFDPASFYYSMVGSSVSDTFNLEHDVITEVLEQDGVILLRSAYDEPLRQNYITGELGLEYTGQTITTEMALDAESLEVLSSVRWIGTEGENVKFYTLTVTYNTPEPEACRALRAAFESEDSMTMSFVIDPGSDHESASSMTIASGTPITFVQGELDFLCFGDPECSSIPDWDWDQKSDYTWYIFTDPDDELVERYWEVYDADMLRYSPEVMEMVIKANGRESILENHESVYYIAGEDGPNAYSVYFDRDGIIYVSCAAFDSLRDERGCWYDQNPGGEEALLGYLFYAMSEEEKEARLAEALNVALLDASSSTEQVQDFGDNGDGTMSLITRASAEDTTAYLELYREDCPEELLNLPSEHVYLLDVQTLELLREEDYILNGEERIPIDVSRTVYDAPRPAAVDRMLSLREEAVLGPDDPDNARTLTVVYDEGTQDEQRYSMQVNPEILLLYELREGYDIVSTEQVDDPDWSDYMSKTVYAAPAA